MKAFTSVICAVLLFSLCLTTTEAHQCTYQGQILSAGEHVIDCVKVICQNNGEIEENHCPELFVMCAQGTRLVYQEQDNSKPYPNCCGRPTCVYS